MHNKASIISDEYYQQQMINHLCCKSCKNLKKLLKGNCDCHIVRARTYQDVATLNINIKTVCQNIYTGEEFIKLRKINYNKWLVSANKIDELEITAASNKIILEEHIRRTELLEEEFKPVRAKVLQAWGIIKFIAALIPFAAAIVGYIYLK